MRNSGAGCTLCFVLWRPSPGSHQRPLKPRLTPLPLSARLWLTTGIILESENKYDPQQTQQKTIDLLDLATESVMCCDGSAVLAPRSIRFASRDGQPSSLLLRLLSLLAASL